MERLKCIEDSLISCVESQLNHLDEVDADELGEVVDMIKDIEEAIYYNAVTKAMEEYESPICYKGDWNKNGKSWNSNHNENVEHSMKEGRSPAPRRLYMEHKEANMDKALLMRELETYMQELTQDIMEMMEGATPEEKQYLNKRVTALANKIT